MALTSGKKIDPYEIQSPLDAGGMGDGALLPRKAAEYAVQVAQGLAAAHDMNIIRRDIKPENDVRKDLQQPLRCRASFEVLECIKESSIG